MLQGRGVLQGQMRRVRLLLHGQDGTGEENRLHASDYHHGSGAHDDANRESCGDASGDRRAAV
jgi:hypothetical protein